MSIEEPVALGSSNDAAVGSMVSQSGVAVNLGSAIQSSSSIEADYKIEIALLGDMGVGKSSLLYRYSDGIFEEGLRGTAGVDHKQKNIIHEGSSVKMQIWDTAG